MVTLEQAKEYLQSQGITIPDFMLQALVDDVNSIQECLDAHYPASKALAITAIKTEEGRYLFDISFQTIISR
ncbi:hypothetical protein M8S09_08775 [Enterobacter chengduensis]|nr:hypothetical protein [Enterobacter chengduensis]MCM7424151.1 hypothetical protein [Enterobacter chengduensis]